LGHFFPVGLWIQRRLGQQDGVLLGRHPQLVVKGVVPDFLHVVPVGHNAMLDRVLEGQDASLGLGLIAHVAVLVAHAQHDALVTWSTDYRWEDGSWSLFASEACLAHARAVVDD